MTAMDTSYRIAETIASAHKRATTRQVSAEGRQMRERSFNFRALLFPMIDGLERSIILAHDAARRRMISDERVESLKSHV
jgi:hypothetical protein